MKTFGRFLTAVILVLGLTVPARAQVADTIQVTIQGDLAEVVLTSELVTPPRIGDTIIFQAQAVDSEGDPVAVVFTWASEDSTALRIETMENGQARGIAIRKATVRVWVMAEPVEDMLLASFRDGELVWGEGHLQEGETIFFCAYLVRGAELVAQSEPPPTCPSVFVSPSTPDPFPLSVVDRIRSFQEINRIGALLLAQS